MNFQFTSKNELLIIGLEHAKASWENRIYEDGGYKQINEDRRNHNIKNINSLIQWYKDKGNLTSNQQELAQNLIENANKRGGVF